MREPAEPRLSTVRDLYDRFAAGYDRKEESRFNRWATGQGRPRAAGYARGHLLEIGIGTGLSLPYYARDVRVRGIDLSPRMLEIAAQRVRDLGRHDELRAMNAQALDFQDGLFDSVAFNFCLCTIPDPALALREAVRVAKPGAPLTFLEHVRSDRLVIALLQDAGDPLTRRFAQDRLNLRTEDLVRSAGIEVISVDRWALGIATLILGRTPS
jgi:ubiquinone/menaquinone biosynthesis C-methylase UbiE